MKLRQIPWKWILLGVFALFLSGLLLLPTLSGSSSLADRAAAALATWTGGEVKLTGPVRVQYFPDVAIRTGFELTNAANLPLVKSIEAKDARISLDLAQLFLGRIRTDAVRLIEPKIVLREAPSPVMGPAQTLQARVANALTGAPLRLLRVQGGTVILPGASGGDTLDTLDAQFDLGSGTGSLSSSGAFVLRGEKVAFQLDSGAPSDTGGGLLVPVTLIFEARPLKATVTGTASFANGFELDGDMNADMANARDFFRWAGIPLAEGQSLGALSVSGAAHWNGTTLIFDEGSFTLDGNVAVGVLAITPGKRPRFDGTLAFDRLALDPYLGTGAAEGATAATGPAHSVLSHFDTDLRISAAEIAAPGLTLGRGGFTIGAREGVVSTEVGELEICGGTVTGRIDVDLSQAANKTTLAGKLSDIPIEDCLAPLGAQLPFTGMGTLKVEFATEGRDYDALARGLAGPFKMKVRKGDVAIDLAHFFAGRDTIEGTGWDGDDVTAFEDLTAECRLGTGHIWCEKFTMKTERGLIAGSGDVNLGQQTLDWRLFVADHAAPLEGSQLAAKAPPQISISGALAQPAIRRAEPSPLRTGSVPAAKKSTQMTPR